jgi:hypothetical protein
MNEAHVKINGYPYTATVRDLDSFAEHLQSRRETFTQGTFGKITYLSPDADAKWIAELKKIIMAKQTMIEIEKQVGHKVVLLHEELGKNRYAYKSTDGEWRTIPMELIKSNVGSTGQIFVNQGYRDYTFIGYLDGEYLIEYVMPKGTTALRLWNSGKNITYKEMWASKWSTKINKDLLIENPQR